MELNHYLPFWEQLTADEKSRFLMAAQKRNYKKGEQIHNGTEECTGLLLVIKGQLRAYMMSDEGKELTLYRLLERDMCLFSASCIIKGIQFDVFVEAERDTTVYHFPSDIYQKMMENSAAVANYTNELMASRFSDVMWLMDQILSKKMDARLAAFLLEESSLAESDELVITHEKIANHLGSAREVVTRMLKYFQTEQMVRITRGNIRITDKKKLEVLALESLR